MSIKIIKLVSGEELICQVDESALDVEEEFVLTKPRALAVAYRQDGPALELHPFLKGDVNGNFNCYKHAVIGYNKSELDKRLEDIYLQEVSGIQLIK